MMRGQIEQRRLVIDFHEYHMTYSDRMTRINYNNKEGKEKFYFTTHSTHFIYGYMASDIW